MQREHYLEFLNVTHEVTARLEKVKDKFFAIREFFTLIVESSLFVVENWT
jgi:hypothetical protein